MLQPSVGHVVHYVATSDDKPCRAAIVTEVPKYLTAEPCDGCPNGTDGQWLASLVVFNPTGIDYVIAAPYNDGGETTGAPNCPESKTHGTPFRYCACGWVEAHPIAGSWHWPEDDPNKQTAKG